LLSQYQRRKDVRSDGDANSPQKTRTHFAEENRNGLTRKKTRCCMRRMLYFTKNYFTKKNALFHAKETIVTQKNILYLTIYTRQ
jgi:hypothetical protein